MAPPFERNRYDPEELIAQFSAQQPKLVAGCWQFLLDTPVGEIGIDLPDDHDSPALPAHAFSLEVLRHVREMDYLVQESCERQFRESNLAHGNFTLGLGWISIAEENVKHETVALTYYGLGVNTMWEAKFQRTSDGQWLKVNF